MTQISADKTKRQNWMAFFQSLSPNIDPQSVRLMDELRMVSHTMYQIGESSLAVAGLSYAQYRILLGLYFAEKMENRSELNPSEISKRRNTISALIRSLEDEGLVERHLDTIDRRKFNISLTQAGQQKVSDHASRHMDVMGSCFAALSSEEQEEYDEEEGEMFLKKVEPEANVQPEIDFASNQSEGRAEENIIRHTLDLDEEEEVERPIQASRNTEPRIDKETFKRRTDERLNRINSLTNPLQTGKNLREYENTPAYLRRKVELDDTAHSSESQVSRFTLSEEEDETGKKSTGIRPNNSFLHDNVD